MEEEHDPLVHSLRQLSDKLMVMAPTSIPDPSVFLPPFLEVIRLEHTNGFITGLALSSVNKFLSYGIISERVVAMVMQNVLQEAIIRMVM
jgi:brefeldin A-resistance guanine nucleotide exchange factor 1